MILFFDTETTGVYDFKLPADSPGQPSIVQFGAILTDDEFRVRGEVNLIVKGVNVPDEAASIHGITSDMSATYGVPMSIVLSLIQCLFHRVMIAVAHNIEFDACVIRSEMLRYGNSSEFMDGIEPFCTMQAMTPICKLPGKYGKYKWPKLQEACIHAFGRSFEGAHDAMADVRACLELYKWLKDPKRVAAADSEEAIV